MNETFRQIYAASGDKSRRMCVLGGKAEIRLKVVVVERSLCDKFFVRKHVQGRWRRIWYETLLFELGNERAWIDRRPERGRRPHLMTHGQGVDDLEALGSHQIVHAERGSVEAQCDMDCSRVRDGAAVEGQGRWRHV